MDGTWDWRTDMLDERQRKELGFAQFYADEYAHGTDGHNRLLLLSKLANILDDLAIKPVDDK